jgi:hypothetical protein
MNDDDDIDSKIEQMKLQFAEGVKLLIYNWSTLTFAINQGLSQENVEVYGEIKKLLKENTSEEKVSEKEEIEKFLKGSIYPNDENRPDSSTPDRSSELILTNFRI